jgi:UPF0042 nucleotide-binding protein
MEVVIVSGLSGAGKTVALKQLEDLGFYCIDNIPLDLAHPMIAHALAHPDQRYQRVALGVDARANAEEIASFPARIEALRAQGLDTRVLFLTAADEIILRRYSETRRRHPLANTEPARSLAEALRHERTLLKPIADAADETLDTSEMNLHELRSAIHQRLCGPSRDSLTLNLISFGFKNGIPDAADFIFDARCLVNPHWIPELRALTGMDPPIVAYLEADPDVIAFRDDLAKFIGRWLPKFREQDRAYITIGVGCTGGRHRSVYLVEHLAAHLRPQVRTVIVTHRDVT